MLLVGALAIHKSNLPEISGMPFVGWRGDTIWLQARRGGWPMEKTLCAFYWAWDRYGLTSDVQIAGKVADWEKKQALKRMFLIVVHLGTFHPLP